MQSGSSVLMLHSDAGVPDPASELEFLTGCSCTGVDCGDASACQCVADGESNNGLSAYDSQVRGYVCVAYTLLQLRGITNIGILSVQ